MRVRVLDYFPAGHIRQRLGGIARGVGKTNARFTTILCEFTERGASNPRPRPASVRRWPTRKKVILFFITRTFRTM